MILYEEKEGSSNLAKSKAAQEHQRNVTGAPLK